MDLSQFGDSLGAQQFQPKNMPDELQQQMLPPGFREQSLQQLQMQQELPGSVQSLQYPAQRSMSPQHYYPTQQQLQDEQMMPPPMQSSTQPQEMMQSRRQMPEQDMMRMQQQMRQQQQQQQMRQQQQQQQQQMRQSAEKKLPLIEWVRQTHQPFIFNFCPNTENQYHRCNIYCLQRYCRPGVKVLIQQMPPPQ